MKEKMLKKNNKKKENPWGHSAMAGDENLIRNYAPLILYLGFMSGIQIMTKSN